MFENLRNIDFEKIRDDLKRALDDNLPFWGSIILVALIYILSVMALLLYIINSCQDFIQRRKFIRAMEKMDREAEEVEKNMQYEPLILQEHRTLSWHEKELSKYIVLPKDIEVSWEDIGGLSTVIEDIQNNTINVLQHRSLINKHSILSISPGILFYGPPGCGKTLLAKGFASQVAFSFINVDVSVLFNQWVGETEKFVKAVFSLAEKIQPCCIFIDEIDSLLNQRGNGVNEIYQNVKGQFLIGMDGLTTKKENQIVVVGATNRIESLDPAILRRMPNRYYIGLPDHTQRCSIFHKVLRYERLQSDFCFARLADLTEGYSGSKIKDVCRNALINKLVEAVSNAAVSIQEPDISKDKLLQSWEDAPLTTDDVIREIEKNNEGEKSDRKSNMYS